MTMSFGLPLTNIQALRRQNARLVVILRLGNATDHLDTL